VKYLLDTNACIALINGEPKRVRDRLDATLQAGATVNISSIVLFELWYGVHKSARQSLNAQRLSLFLSGPLVVLPFEEGDAEAAGRIRAELERNGKPIGAYDLLIAGQALRIDATLVTANSSEFRRIKSLRWEDWSKP
jgi:tRNA(fMet)-specific endonuclease VapC